MNKREFVLGGCAAVAGGTVSACPDAAASASAGAAAVGLRRQRLPDLATDMRSAAWQRYLGHGFTGPGGVQLTLKEVKPQGNDRVLEQFTLRFDATGAALSLEGGTQVLAHGSGQRVALYLDPAGTLADEASAYNAHFCLMA